MHVETVLRWARAGQLRGVKLARQWRFTAAAVEEFISAQQTVQATPAA